MWETVLGAIWRAWWKFTKWCFRKYRQILPAVCLFFAWSNATNSTEPAGSRIGGTVIFGGVAILMLLLWQPALRGKLRREVRIETGAIKGRLPKLARGGAQKGIVIGTAVVGVGVKSAQIGPRDNLYVVGPPRSGKTSQVILPTLLEWRGPAVATSTRRDVASALVDAGRPVDLIYIGIGGIGDKLAAHRVSWDLLIGCADPSVAARRAKMLVDATSSTDSTGSSYWQTSATVLLQNLFLAAAALAKDMTEVLNWLQTGLPDVDAYVDALPELRPVASYMASFRHQMTTASAAAVSTKSVAENALSWVNVLPRVIAPYFDIMDFVSSDRTLALVYESGDASLAPYFSCLISEIYLAGVSIAGDQGGQLNRHLLLALDELANLAPIADLPSWLSQSAGWGIQIMSIFQSTAQAVGCFGESGAAALRDSSTVKLFLRGVNDQDTIQYLTHLAGEKVDRVTQISHSGGQKTISTARETREVLPAAQIVSLAPGRAIWVEGGRQLEVIKLKHYKRGK